MRRLLGGVAIALICVATLHGFYQPELIGGTPVDKKDFPAVVYASMGGGRCSATVVGPRTLIYAAHCVSNGGTASFTGIDGSKYTAKCTHAPQYNQAEWERLRRVLHEVTPTMIDVFTANNTMDIAICKIDRKVTGTIYERLETRAQPFAIGDQPLLSGYGCTQPGGGAGNDGILRVGRASVTGIPSGNSNHVITKGKAANCFGDSGGPMFWTNGSSYEDRSVVSVNSLGNISDTSYQAALFTPMAKSFIQEWKTTNNEPICGYDSMPECRGSKPQTPVSFTVESADAKLSVVVEPAATYSVDEAKLALQSALNSLETK